MTRSGARAALRGAGGTEFWIPVLGIALLCLIVAGVVAATLMTRMQSTTQLELLEPDAPARRAAGEALYRRECAACHGGTLGGGQGGAPGVRAPALDGGGHAHRHRDVELFQIVSQGMRGPDGTVRMPSFGAALSGDEIISVLSYIAGSWPAEIRQARRDPDWMFPGACTPDETVN